MDLPDPFDFRNSDVENSTAEFTTHDLLQKFHSNESRHRKGDREKQEGDRRLNLMRHHCEHDLEDETLKNARIPVQRLDPNSNLKFLGEQLVSYCNRLLWPSLLIGDFDSCRRFFSENWAGPTTPCGVGPADFERGLAFLSSMTKGTVPRSQCLIHPWRTRLQNFF